MFSKTFQHPNLIDFRKSHTKDFCIFTSRLTIISFMSIYDSEACSWKFIQRYLINMKALSVKPFFLGFQHFRQYKLSPVTWIIKYTVLCCDSVRLLKMANLSCIHITIELFQSSEVYLEPCQTLGMKRFCDNC